ncbi:MAG: cell division protein ZapA [Nitrospinota bacterium]|jgi:cell division protein ZapA (FtsZ GTPase activity inhibitor)
MKNITQVKIFDNIYTIKSDTDPSYTAELANFVDNKIREVAVDSTTISLHKITILAFMNMAHDFLQLKEKYKAESLQIDEKIIKLTQIIKENQE